MTSRALRWLRMAARNSQKGFTLIEMLVVISILGILAAVVTMSMIGVTSLAQKNANDAETHTVQIALDTMAAQQQVPTGAVCTSPFPDTQYMSQFPVSASSAAPGFPVALYPNYLHKDQLTRKYTCDTNGVVSPAGP